MPVKGVLLMFHKSLTIVLAVILGLALQTRTATAGIVFDMELMSMELNATGVSCSRSARDGVAC